MRLFSGTRPVALVTGAAKRVGLASAKALARAGCDVVITYNNSAEDAEAAVTELRGLGAAAKAEKLDLLDAYAAETWAERAARELPRIDAIVHNASVYEESPLARLNAAAMGRDYVVHVVSPVLITKQLAPLLARSDRPGGGAVVCMCDIHALGRPRRGYVAYAASKAALAELVRSLAVELAPKVRVNGVAPGAVAFAAQGPDADPEMQRRYLSRVPLARSGTPEEAAEVVRWLALDATYVTGEIVRVDGGRWGT